MEYVNKIEAVRYKSVASNEHDEVKLNINRLSKNNGTEITIVDEESSDDDDAEDDVTIDAAEMINSMYREQI